MNSFGLIALLDHLWQSTLFAVLVGYCALLLRKNGARARYLLWLAASAKFLVPFGLFVAMGALVPWHPGPTRAAEPTLFSTPGHAAVQITQFGAHGATALAGVIQATNHGSLVLIALGVLWGLGMLAVTCHRSAQWKLIRRALRDSTETDLAFPIPVRSSSSQFEPGIVGILHPVLLLPKGLERRLTPEEMRAVLAHERCHVKWADNLGAGIHMLVEALFWFHPLVWWLGMRLVDERERACDEQALAEGHSPESYAEGILKVCEHYLESGLACVAGISRANLGSRIADIMKNRPVEKMGAGRKMVITLGVCATIAVPIAIGVLTARHAQAQEALPAADGLVTINFKDAAIGQVASAVTVATHKTFVLDPRVHAKVTVLSTTPMTPEAFYQVFLSVLAAHNLATSPGAGGATQIFPAANQGGFPHGEDTSNPDEGTGDEFLTQAVALNNVSAAELARVLRHLVPVTGQLSAYGPGRMIIISDHASNVNRLMKIISQIDQPGPVAR